MDTLVEMTLKNFLDELASGSPAPGGGSVAALSGALGAALSSMVCNLTIGKENYDSVQKELRDALKKSEQIRIQLTKLIDKDTEAFNDVMRAIKMPKDTEEQKETRKQALQNAYKNATTIPLETAQTCEKVFDIALIVAQKGNKHSITDAAVSAIMAQAGIKAAVLNVKINLGSIKDLTFVQKTMAEIETLLRKTEEKMQNILTIVQTSL